MDKINSNGITAENITGILVLAIALINAVLQIFGINTIPVTDDDIANLVSVIFLISTTAWNTWKNRNITGASQIAQEILDAIKNNEIQEEDIHLFLRQTKKVRGDCQ